MDKVKVRQLELEIEKINRVQDEGENQDTADGFKRFVKKQLQKICSEKYEKKTAGASSFLDGAKRSRGEGDAGLADVYDFSHPERGLAIIINNEDFSLSDCYDDRPGSSYDAMALYQTFTNLGFRVWVKKNLKAWQMVEVLKSAKDGYDHANADCFVCAILSHGNETLVQEGDDSLGLRVRKDLLFGTDGKAVPTSTIMELFSDYACHKLEGKPRLFFIQACRGEKYDDGIALSVTKETAYTSESGRQSFHETDHGNTQDGTRRPHSNTEASSSSYAPKSQTDATDAKPDISQETIEEGVRNVTLNATSSEALDATDAQGAPLRDVYVCPTPLYKDSLIMYATPPAKDGYDHANADCFVCAILSHGNETLVQEGDDSLGLRVRKDLLFGTDGKAVPTSTIMELFSDYACHKLEGKPRLFFIQACRGEKYDDGIALSVTKETAYTSESGRQSFHETDHGNTQDGTRRPHSNTEASSSSYAPKSQTDATDAKPDISQETIEEGVRNVTLNATSSEALDATDAQGAPLRDVYVCPTPLYKDSLIMYATPPGYFAWRRKTGAWFVQSLCRVLNSPEIGSRSLLSALVHVVGTVAREYQSEAPSKPYMHQKKEVPVIESMLVKDVFFAPK